MAKHKKKSKPTGDEDSEFDTEKPNSKKARSSAKAKNTSTSATPKPPPAKGKAKGSTKTADDSANPPAKSKAAKKAAETTVKPGQKAAKATPASKPSGQPADKEAPRKESAKKADAKTKSNGSKKVAGGDDTPLEDSGTSSAIPSKSKGPKPEAIAKTAGAHRPVPPRQEYIGPRPIVPDAFGARDMFRTDEAEPLYFHNHYAVFANWHLDPFQGSNGNKFRTAEQFIMYHKALLFKDAESASKILRFPILALRLGDLVKGFDEATWDANKQMIAIRALWFKFAHMKSRREQLLDTGTRVLINASSDRVWGIGYRAERAEDSRLKWGQNLLGICLMDARSLIAEALPTLHDRDETIMFDLPAGSASIPEFNDTQDIPRSGMSEEVSDEPVFLSGACWCIKNFAHDDWDVEETSGTVGARHDVYAANAITQSIRVQYPDSQYATAKRELVLQHLDECAGEVAAAVRNMTNGEFRLVVVEVNWEQKWEARLGKTLDGGGKHLYIHSSAKAAECYSSMRRKKPKTALENSSFHTPEEDATPESGSPRMSSPRTNNRPKLFASSKEKEAERNRGGSGFGIGAAARKPHQIIDLDGSESTNVHGNTAEDGDLLAGFRGARGGEDTDAKMTEALMYD